MTQSGSDMKFRGIHRTGPAQLGRARITRTGINIHALRRKGLGLNTERRRQGRSRASQHCRPNQSGHDPATLPAAHRHNLHHCYSVWAIRPQCSKCCAIDHKHARAIEVGIPLASHRTNSTLGI